MDASAKKWVSTWLFIGLILVFVQVVIGGITRLTDSGLSITEWELVKGVLPPVGDDAWNIAFEKYQIHAKKQFESIHSEMTLSDFKVIYFWEWFHRLWARSMGLIFIFPFIYFLYKKWLPSWLIKNLAVVILLAALAGTFGWIMVASGLDEDNRTWVSAYKLATHLLIATALFSYLFYTYLKVSIQEQFSTFSPKIHMLTKILIAICVLQITFGAFMAGMRAGAIHPHWPIFMGNNHLLEIAGNPGLIQEAEIINYEGSVWIKSIVQIVHRFLAGILFILLSYIVFLSFKNYENIKKASIISLSIVIIQYILGILTLLGIIGNKSPVFLGVAHQGVALLLLISMLYLFYITRNTKKIELL
jgi:cytochrome c oxidase assembly protein subunit 15